MATPKTTAAVIAVVALFLASIAAYLVYGYFTAQEKKIESQSMQVQPIVVAAAEIPFGARLQPEQMKIADWPKDSLPAGHAVKVEDLAGRISVANIQAGSPIVESQLAPVSSEGGVMSYIIPEGHRAITVAVNEVVGVAGFVLPNSIVDVVATVNSPFAKSGNDQRISKIILQNVKVLAVGQILEQKEGKPVVVPTVTLDVKPEDAETLVLASENKVQLILRHIGDSTETKTKGATVSSMLGGPPPAKPSSARPAKTGSKSSGMVPGTVVEIIKGGEKSKQEFK
ncbi:MAG TPA: Flp pilus assembly protein CpaB [Nitrospirota bacterium]|jgi:pilus assembly protein CpaB